jgi:hypothetical protein
MYVLLWYHHKKNYSSIASFISEEYYYLVLHYLERYTYSTNCLFWPEENTTIFLCSNPRNKKKNLPSAASFSRKKYYGLLSNISEINLIRHMVRPFNRCALSSLQVECSAIHILPSFFSSPYDYPMYLFIINSFFLTSQLSFRSFLPFNH